MELSEIIGVRKNTVSLQFDIDSFIDMRNKIDEIIQDLTQLNSTLKEEMATLKTEWKTNAATNFFNEYDLGWSVQVEKYINTLYTVEKLLQTAQTNYQNVEDELGSIKF